MQKLRDLVIIGDSAFAEVACEYFSNDSEYTVVGFAVERPFLTRAELMGRPVVALDEAATRFPPDAHDAYAAIVYTQLNRLRTRLADLAEAMGYRLASFISPHARISPSATIGPHCFIFENNVVQPFVAIGRNTVLWSGNHIGHHSRIGANVFVSSHVVVSGFSVIGDNCFLGVNAALGNNLTVAADCWIGPGVTLTRDTEEDQIYRTETPGAAKVGAHRFFKVPTGT